MMPDFRNQEQLKLKPFLDWLPGEDLTIVEVGCFAGHGTLEMLEHHKIAEVICIDPYIGGYDPGDAASACNMVEAFREWADRVASTGLSKPFSLMTKCGRTPLRRIGEPGGILEAVNVVYIDGNHRYEEVKRDIIACCMSLRKSDYLQVVAGHDYGRPHHPGVKMAVDEIFGRPHEVFPDSSWAVVRNEN